MKIEEIVGDIILVILDNYEPLKKIGKSAKSGTTISFKPSPKTFTDTSFHYDVLAKRLRELSFLNSGLTISLFDERSNKKGLFPF